MLATSLLLVMALAPNSPESHAASSSPTAPSHDDLAITRSLDEHVAGIPKSSRTLAPSEHELAQLDAHAAMPRSTLSFGVGYWQPTSFFGAPAPVPSGQVGGKTATSGSTDVTGATDKFNAAEQPHNLEDTKLTSLDINAGALLSTGNARNFAMTGGVNFKIQRGRHRFGSAAAMNYAAAALPDAGTNKWQPTALNVQGKARYDVFFAKRWVAYVNSTARHDRFQGLDLRLNVGPGFGYYFIAQPKHELWAELGYDFQYDLRRDDARGTVDADGNPIFGPDGVQVLLAKNGYRNAARLFLGYVNQINDKVAFNAGVEYLQGFIKTADFAVSEQIRVNLETGLTVQLIKSLAINTTFAMRFDNGPLPDVRKLDTATALSLVYRFF